jgi:hypothetical protein
MQRSCDVLGSRAARLAGRSTEHFPVPWLNLLPVLGYQANLLAIPGPSA